MPRLLAIASLFMISAFAEPSRASELPQPYTNPIDGKTYSAVWRDYSDHKKGKNSFGVVSVKGVRLLSRPLDFTANLERGALDSYTETIAATVAFFLDKADAPFSILVDLTLLPQARPSIQLASQGKVTPRVLAELNNGLQRLPDLRSKSDILQYQIELTVQPDGGGGGEEPGGTEKKDAKVIPLAD